MKKYSSLSSLVIMWSLVLETLAQTFRLHRHRSDNRKQNFGSFGAGNFLAKVMIFASCSVTVNSLRRNSPWKKKKSSKPKYFIILQGRNTPQTVSMLSSHL